MRIPAGSPIRVGHGLHPTKDPACCGTTMISGQAFECPTCGCKVITSDRVVIEVQSCRNHNR